MTQRKYKLDTSGNMLSMQGKVYKVSYAYTYNKVEIWCEKAKKAYIFHHNDVYPVNLVSEKSSNVFKFDEQQLIL